MIAFFLPLPEPTGTPENTAEIDRIIALRREVMEDYLQFKTQSGVWQSLFTKPRPEAKTMEEKVALQKQMIFEDVGKYPDEVGYHNGRLVFFEAWAPSSDFYTHVAKRLLSMRSAGSISARVRRFTNAHGNDFCLNWLIQNFLISLGAILKTRTQRSLERYRCGYDASLRQCQSFLFLIRYQCVVKSKSG
jgi:hypothetical protein